MTAETETGDRDMSEENVVALKWLIASLETRIIDLEAGRLDESLEELAKNPIPLQYRSLCQELKCIFPTISSFSEHTNNTTSINTSSVVIKDASLNENLNGIASPIINTTNHSHSRSLAHIISAPENSSIIVNVSSLPTTVLTDQLNPSLEHTTRKRKLSVGGDDDDGIKRPHALSAVQVIVGSTAQLLHEKLRTPQQIILSSAINNTDDEFKSAITSSSDLKQFGQFLSVVMPYPLPPMFIVFTSFFAPIVSLVFNIIIIEFFNPLIIH